MTHPFDEFALLLIITTVLGAIAMMVMSRLGGMGDGTGRGSLALTLLTSRGCAALLLYVPMRKETSS